MADSIEHVIAPGIKVSRHWWGWWAAGRVDALVAAGVIEPDWVADDSDRLENGKRQRTVNTVCGGILYETKMKGKHRCELRIFSGEKNGHRLYPLSAEQVVESLSSYDGRSVVNWGDCEWHPYIGYEPSAIARAEAARRLKRKR